MSNTTGTLEDLIDKVQRRAPEYLDLLTAETDDDFEAAFDVLLDKAVRRIEANSKNYAVLKEEGLTAVLAAELSIPGLTVTQESNSNGHVDLTIVADHCSPERRKLGEAKIDKGPEYVMKGVTQLLDRYATGREGRGLLLIYVQRQDIAGRMQTLRDRMDTERPHGQTANATDHQVLKWSFATVHPHSCGDDCHVDHIGLNLFAA